MGPGRPAWDKCSHASVIVSGEYPHEPERRCRPVLQARAPRHQQGRCPIDRAHLLWRGRGLAPARSCAESRRRTGVGLWCGHNPRPARAPGGCCCSPRQRISVDCGGATLR